jgi:hypothetical protein
VWVLPGGQNELSKLTLLILDYAVNQPALINTLDAEYRLNKKGEPIEAGEEPAIIVRGTFDASKPLPLTIETNKLNIHDPKGRAREESATLDILRERVVPLYPERFLPPFIDNSIFGLEQRLRPLMQQPVPP